MIAPASAPAPALAPSAPAPTTRVGPSLITHREAFALADVQLSIEDVHMSTHLDDLQRTTSAAEELRASGCEEALNLDGGPSTGWASPRSPVRHAVVFRRR